AGKEADTVGFEVIEGVLDLLEAAVDVRRRDGGEQAEAAAVIGSRLGGVLVELATEPARLLDIVAVPHTGLRDRQNGGGDAALVHVLERALRRPLRRRWTGAAARAHHCLDVKRRNEMVVDVDARLRRRRLSESRCRARCRADAERCRTGGDEVAPIRIGRRLRTAGTAPEESSC